METVIELTDEQRLRLEAVCRAEGKSASEEIGEALAAHFASKEREASEMSLEERMAIRLAGAGRWKNHKVEPNEFLEQIRSEWDRCHDESDAGDGFGSWGPPDFDARDLVDVLRGEWDERANRLGY